MKRLIVLCLALWTLFSTTIFGQYIEASTSAKDVYSGQSFDVTFSLKNAPNASFSKPNFEPFKVLSGPFRSTKMQIINGQTTSSTGYTFRLSASKPGNYTIPSATMQYRGSVFKSKPLNIRVLKGSKDNILNNSELYLELQKSDSIVYVGQQLILDYSLYYGRQNIQSSTLNSEFPRDNFLVFQIREGSNIQTQQVEHKGKVLNKANINSLAMYLLRSGSIQIPATTFKIVTQSDQVVQRGFFQFYDSKNEMLTVPRTTIDVKPLPPGAPDDFTGVVGDLNVTIKADRTSVNTGEEIILTVVAQGDGIGSQLELPGWEHDLFSVYDAKSIGSENIILDNRINFRKAYEVLLIPNKPGNHTVSFECTHFNPTTGKYERKKTNSIAFNVGGSSIQKEDASQKSLDQNNNSFSAKNKWLWIIGLLALVAGSIAIFLGMRTSQKDKATPSAKVAPEIAAKERAIQKLSSAKSLLDQNQTGKYWETLESSIRIYLEEKLDIPTSIFSKQTVQTAWNDKHLPLEEWNTWEAITSKINRARYAGQNISEMEKLYQEALDWIQTLELKHP